MLADRLDVILLDVRDGESLAYNHAYENLRLGAVASAVEDRGRTARFADLTTVESVVATAERPLLVLDAFFRVAERVTTALVAARAANPDVAVLCFGRAARTIWGEKSLRTLIDHFEFYDEVSAVLRLLGEHPTEWIATTPGRPGTHGWIERGVVDIEATRGCEHQCTFCGVDVGAAGARMRRWRARPPTDVAAEMLRWSEATGLSRFQFVDDNLLGSPRHSEQWIREFTSALRALRLAVNFSFYGRLDHTLLELLPELRDAGLVQLHAGVESGSDAVLHRLRKGITTSQMETAIEALEESGVELVASLIVFEQRMSLTELADCITWVEATSLERYFSLTTAIPFAGTALRTEFEDSGIPVVPQTNRLGFPDARVFAHPDVQRAYDNACTWEEAHAPGGSRDLESLMRMRFSHEERLGVIDHPQPRWLDDLRSFRLSQLRTLRDGVVSVSA